MPHCTTPGAGPRLAVPSWVLPGSVAENCRFLEGRVREVALCLFEAEACLAYTDDDLPPGGGSLRFHAHLPTDLDWHCADTGLLPACSTALAVLARVAHLHPHCAVLHPPATDTATAADLLAAFLRQWRAASPLPLLLENTPHMSLTDLAARAPGLFGPDAYGLCLDLGHLLGYHRQDLPDPSLARRVRMVHWNAPGRGGRHLPLTALDGRGLALARELMDLVPQDCLHVIEIFDWQGVQDSLPVVQALWQARRQGGGQH